MSKKTNINPLIADNWFAQHPEKILGTAYQTTTKYGNEATGYKGTIENLNKIDVPNAPILRGIYADAHVEIDRQAVSPQQTQKPKEQENSNVSNLKSNISRLKKANKQAKKDIAKNEILKANPEAKHETISQYDMILRDMKGEKDHETGKWIRKPISESEVKAYLWYQNSIGKYRQGDWLKFLDPKQLTGNEEDELITKWLKEGSLFVHNGRFIYHAFYLSGDIYEKYADFHAREKQIGENSNANAKAEHDKAYGEGTYDQQKEAIAKEYADIRKRALSISDNQGESITLKPTSEFCRNIYINTLQDEVPFTGVPSEYKDARGRIIPRFDKLKSDKTRYRKTTFEELSLTNAFVYWLIAKNDQITYEKFGVTWKHVYNIGILQKTEKRKLILNGVKFTMVKRKYKDLTKLEKKVYDAETIRVNTLKQDANSEKKRLFRIFLLKEVKQTDLRRIELQFNRTFLNFTQPDYDRIPVGFEIAKYYPGTDNIEIRPEKREAVNFLNITGSGILAYDVGMGKTWSEIFRIAQLLDDGLAKRCMVVVPDSTYGQWRDEIKGLLPHRKFNDFYNLRKSYYNKIVAVDGSVIPLEEGSITVITESGMEMLGLNDETLDKLITQYFDMFSKEFYPKGKKGANEILALRQKILRSLGYAQLGSQVSIDELGIDHIAFDEAHHYKNLFKKVQGIKISDEKGSPQEDTKYQVTGTESKRAVKAFMLSRYVQYNNKNSNVDLLTATPVTNNPIEVYAMLSFVAYEAMKEGITFQANTHTPVNNMARFFDMFVEGEYILVADSSLNFQYKYVFTEWINLKVLQTLLFQHINYKNTDTKDKHGRQVKLIRPNKIQVPYKGEYDKDGNFVEVAKKDRINMVLKMNGMQQMFSELRINYSEGDDFYTYDNFAADIYNGLLVNDSDKISPEFIAELKRNKIEVESIDKKGFGFSDTEYTDVEYEDVKELAEKIGTPTSTAVAKTDKYVEDVETEDVDFGAILDKDSSNTENRDKARIMVAISIDQSNVLSPYTVKLLNQFVLKKPTAVEFIKSSNKLLTTVKMIAEVRDLFKNQNKPIPGQVIYMNRGTAYLHLIQEYLINEVGFEPHEVGIIKGGMIKTETKDEKKEMQDRFLGRKYDRITGTYTSLPENERMKVLIGTDAIKEGVNLQKHGLLLYNLSPQFNPSGVVQLIGRIYRQGNIYKNVFIITPLMANSIDIFFMQKNEEKIKLIGMLWVRNNLKNSFETEAFDPREAKLDLMQDPMRIAEFEVQQIQKQLSKDNQIFLGEIQLAKYVITQLKTIEEYEPKLRLMVDFWRPVHYAGKYDKKPKEIWHMTKDEFLKYAKKHRNKAKEIEKFDIVNYKDTAGYVSRIVDKENVEFYSPLQYEFDKIKVKKSEL